MAGGRQWEDGNKDERNGEGGVKVGGTGVRGCKVTSEEKIITQSSRGL